MRTKPRWVEGLLGTEGRCGGPAGAALKAQKRGGKLDTRFHIGNGAAGGNSPLALGSAAIPAWNIRGLRLEALANVGHELRTPIQVLLGYLEMLREEYRDGIPQEPLAIIERMNANVHDLAETVENIMQFAQTAVRAEPALEQDVKPAELTAELRPALEAALRDKPLELKFDLGAAPRSFRGCLKPLRVIVTNLARNAIKFTDRGAVTIAIRADKRGEVEIEVSDTGPGISASRLEEAFQPLVQLSHSSARRYRGMGLGLAVVRHNVEAMGGRLEVRSTPGLGSSFKVVLPRREALSPPREGSSASPAAALERAAPAACSAMCAEDAPDAGASRSNSTASERQPAGDAAAAKVNWPACDRQPHVTAISRAPLHNRIAAAALSSSPGVRALPGKGVTHRLPFVID